MRIAAVATAILVMVCGVGGALLYAGIIRFNHPSLEAFPIQGVDVSHHQGAIDWGSLQSSRVRFAYIKASEGATFRDPRFLINWSQARQVGVIPGAYHYFTLCRPGAEQASNFLAVLSTAIGRRLPPAIDLEYGGNCVNRPTVSEFWAELDEFLEIVERQAGCRAVLYVTKEFHETYVVARAHDRRLWVRNIYRQPPLPDPTWHLWQFANRGRMPGVETYVDLNAFRGDAAAFSRFRCETAQQFGSWRVPAGGPSALLRGRV